MSICKGKEVAAEADWKAKLAMLDQELGWDEQAGSDWASSSEAEEQEVFTPNRPSPSKDENKNCANNLQSTEKDRGAHVEQSDSVEDAQIMSADKQNTIWEAGVQEASSIASAGPNSNALYDDEDQEDIYTAPKQQQDEEDLYEEEEEEQEKEPIRAKSMLTAYLYHRFGPEIRYENRCSCCEHLYDGAEEGKKRKRQYFAQAGETGLIKDPCVLLPYPQDDIPGTKDVDKPVLMVTTPDGDTLYPHDTEEYPEPPAATWHGPRIGWGGAAPQGGYVVPYEDEDGADI